MKIKNNLILFIVVLISFTLTLSPVFAIMNVRSSSSINEVTIDGKWTNAELMDGPFYSEKHDYDPCISPDGNYFYFTSDRDGGLGGSDIYVVEKIIKN